jgi:hypothetical protein
MKVSALAVAQVGLLNVLPTTAEYVWPSKHDRMEDLLVLQNGYIREGFVDGTCHIVNRSWANRLTFARRNTMHS